MGCNSGSVTETVEQATLSPTRMFTATVTKAILPTEETISTSTQTSVVAIHPVVILSPEEALSRADFLKQTEECELPCWNGVTPGQTSPSELPGYFARLGFSANLQEAIEFEPRTYALSGRIMGYPAPKGNLPPRVTAYWKDGPVLTSSIAWDWFPEFLGLGSVKAHLGAPNEIYVSTSGQGESSRYIIVLEYRSYQTAIVITGTSTSGYDENDKWKREICLTNSEAPNASVRLFAESVTALEFINFASDPLDWSSELGISEDELFDALEGSDQCATLPEQ